MPVNISKVHISFAKPTEKGIKLGNAMAYSGEGKTPMTGNDFFSVVRSEIRALVGEFFAKTATV